MERFLAFGFMMASAAAAQSFEVASVRQAKGTESRVGYFISGNSGAKLTVFNLSLLSLIGRAYNVREYQISGPDWLKGPKYEIKAKLPSGTPRTGMPAAVQTLLADRFKLASHRETKELPFYALTVAKDGPKLQPSEGRGSTIHIRGLYKARNESMARLCDTLSRILDRVVVDSTGLSGAYDFVLDYTPDDPRFSDSAGAKSVFTALPEQLGLKLEWRKGPVEVLVIDRVERMPAAN
jgi:uncharacterized protein (TIGR03435 family)